MSIKGRVVAVEERNIRGWAYDTAHEDPVLVTLELDGRPINQTWAIQHNKRLTDVNDGYVSFSFGMRNLWRHLREGQQLEVKVDGQPLSVKGTGSSSYRVRQDGEDPIDVHARLDGSSVINKFGSIQPKPEATDDWTERVLPEYLELQTLFSEGLDLPLFIFHGALLGIAREGGLIAHDHDIDLAYLSNHTRPEHVRAEFFQVQQDAIRHRHHLSPGEFKLSVVGHQMSITVCWFDDSGRLFNSYGFVGERDLTPDDILPLASSTVQGYELAVPRRPDAVSRYTYGRHWRYPDPGWRWLGRYKSRPEMLAARLDEQQVAELKGMRTRLRAMAHT